MLIRNSSFAIGNCLAIVTEIEAEQALVNSNRELIERMERKTKAALARVWGAATAA